MQKKKQNTHEQILTEHAINVQSRIPIDGLAGSNDYNDILAPKWRMS